MGIKQAIRNLLLADATLAASIGTRVSPVISGMADKLPRIIYTRTNIDSTEHLVGVASLRYDRFNIVVHSNTIDECETIAERVKVVLDGVINDTLTGVLVRRCLLESSTEDHWTPEGREKPIYEIIQSWEIGYHG